MRPHPGRVPPRRSSASFTALALRYVTGRAARGEIAPGTARNYEHLLLSFATMHAKVEPQKVRRRHVEAWLEQPTVDRRSRPAPNYQRARLSVLRGFFRWCVIERHVDRDPTLGIPLAPVPPLIARSLTTDQAHAVMALASEDPRSKLMALLMLQCGLRRGEVAALQLGDLDMRKRTLGVRGKGGQGGVTRRTYIPDELLVVLEAYLPSVPGTSGLLIRSRTKPDRGLRPDTVYKVVVQVMRQAGVKRYAWDGRSPHSLRHTCAQDLVDDGVELRVVQKVLGHKSIRNTEIYTVGAVANLVTALEGRTYLVDDRVESHAHQLQLW